MAIPSLLAVSALIWAILSFFILPRRRAAIRRDPSPQSLAAMSSYSVLEVVRSATAICATVGVLFIGFLWALQFTGTATADRVADAMVRVRGWKEMMSSISPFWSALVLIVSAVGLAVLARRTARLRVQEALKRVFEREFERVAGEFNRGEARELPRSDEMTAIDDQLEKGRALLAGLEGQTSEEAVRARDGITAAMRELSQQRVFADVRRRMNLQVDPDEVLDPEPVTARERIRAFFVSRGIVRVFHTGNRLMFAATAALLIASLVGINASASAGSAERRLVELSDLQVTLNAREAEQDWQQARASLAAQAGPESLDDDALDALSHVFENSFADQSVWSTIPRSAISIRAQVARQQILRISTARTGATVDLVGGLDQASNATPLERGVLQGLDTAAESRGPRTAVGRQFKHDLRRAVAETPGLGRRLRTAAAEAAHAFQQRAATDDFSRLLIGRLMGVGMDQAGADAAITELAQQIDRALGQGRRAHLYGAKSLEFMTALANGQSVEQAAARVASAARPFWSPSEVSTFTNYVSDHAGAPTLESHPPSLAARDEPHLNVQAARQVVQELEAPGRRTAEALSTFEDYFPAQEGRELRTARGQLLQMADDAGHAASPGSGVSTGGGGGFGGGGGGGGGRSTRSSPGRTASASFARARSFSSLRGFARIGGVLIGVPPVGGPALDFRSFSWRRDPGGLVLFLTRPNGQPLSLGPYREAIVHQALAYAADGRPVTVTMVTADPLPELKILLHPALVDSPLGCRAIEIDRLVDIYAGRTLPDRSTQQMEIRDQHALYRRAWAERLEALADEALPRLSPADRRAFLSVRERAERIRQNPAANESAARALSARHLLKDPARSVLSVKDAYYDKTLVADLKQCATNTDVRQFSACINLATTRQRATLMSGSLDWIASPPDFTFWSGVREAEFSVDPDLGFMKRAAGDGPAQRLWPFNFMLQVAFTSTPSFTSGDAEAHNDDKPWEFPALRSQIMTAVDQGMSPTHRQVVADLAEFTALQRLFRLALGERLGPAFPIQQLTALAKATAPSVRTERTLRWNARPGAIEHQLESDLSELIQNPDPMARLTMPGVIDQLRSCVSDLRSSTNSFEMAAPQWPSSCTRRSVGGSAVKTPGPPTWLSYVGDLLDTASRAHQLRKSMGVSADDAQVGRKGCGAV